MRRHSLVMQLGCNNIGFATHHYEKSLGGLPQYRWHRINCSKRTEGQIRDDIRINVDLLNLINFSSNSESYLETTNTAAQCVCKGQEFNLRARAIAVTFARVRLDLKQPLPTGFKAIHGDATIKIPS